MIKVIIFDVGGVYLQGSFVNFMNQAYSALGINQIYRSNKQVVLDEEFNKELISIEACFIKIFQVTITPQQMQKLINLWTVAWTLQPEMDRLIKRLKKRYQLAILSNSDPVNSPNCQKKGWYQDFNPVILSHELHVLKPCKQIYQIALQQIGKQAGQCLFIDDQPDCLFPAQEMGMKTILYQNMSQLKRDLLKLG